MNNLKNIIYYYRLLKFYIKLPYTKFSVYLDKGVTYSDNLFFNKLIHDKQADKLVIFSHFDKHNIIDDYVIFYMTALKQMGADIVFISTAEELKEDELSKISSLSKRIVVKQNIGYDFGAWRTGIYLESEDLEKYSSLVLCNDSVYAPLYDLQIMFEEMKNKYDFWGITDNYQYAHHIQSYFMVFSNRLIIKPFFTNFWQNIKVFKRKISIILNYEIGFTKLIRLNGYQYAVYCPSEKKLLKNSTHQGWKNLIINQKSPTVKIELLRDNPDKADIEDWETFITDNTLYDVNLIIKHLARVNS